MRNDFIRLPYRPAPWPQEIRRASKGHMPSTGSDLIATTNTDERCMATIAILPVKANVHILAAQIADARGSFGLPMSGASGGPRHVWHSPSTERVQPIPGPATAEADDKHHTSKCRKPTLHAPPLHSLPLRFYEEYTSPALSPSRALRPHSQHRRQKPVRHGELDPTGGKMRQLRIDICIDILFFFLCSYATGYLVRCALCSTAK